MEDIEIQIFDEINDYKEKIGIMTFRQWIFAALIVLTVVPTYILIPKYTFISDDIASYIVIIEAAILGFIGFVKIHNLPAEKIIPYWYRHYFVFNKPIEYKSTKEYQIEQEEKKDKKKKKAKKMQEIHSEAQQESTSLTKKQLKEVQKQQKALAKARKKYGYKFKEESPSMSFQMDTHGNTEVLSNSPVNTAPVQKEKNAEQNNTVKISDEAVSPPLEDKSEKMETEILEKKKSIETEKTEPIVTSSEDNENVNNNSNEQELDEKLKSLSDEEKKVLLKLLGK